MSPSPFAAASDVMTTCRRAVVALGSNMGDSVENLKTAVSLIADLPTTRVTAVSRLYSTKPVGGPVQADFLNAAVLVESEFEAREFLTELHRIEANLGRVREVVWGPRTIDLDLIDMQDVVSDVPELLIPHPRAHERQFVVVPMCDIAPAWNLSGSPVSSLVVDDPDVTVISDFGWSES